jgi:four helix bundle protein
MAFVRVSYVRRMGDYRQLAVWQRAQNLALAIYRSTDGFPVRERYGLAAQMRRAAVSVVSNIAEGCGRQGDRELSRFLRIARGSVHELECQLTLSRDLGYLKGELWTVLHGDTHAVSKMLNGLIRAFPRQTPLNRSRNRLRDS